MSGRDSDFEARQAAADAWAKRADAAFRWSCRAVLGSWCVFVALVFGLASFGCTSRVEPQQGGGSEIHLGGSEAPSVVTTQAPENPQTPSTTTVEKTVVTEYELSPDESATADTQGVPAREQPETSLRSASAQFGTRVAGVTGSGASPAARNVSVPGAAAPARIMRKSVHEKATTTTGTSWQDTARELGAKLAAVQPVIWIGALAIPLGVYVGYRTAKKGWLVNGILLGGAIAGSGAAMIGIALWAPDINPLVGLGFLSLGIVALLVWAAYHKSQHDAAKGENSTLPAA